MPLVFSASDNPPSLVNNTSRNSVHSSTTPGDGNSDTSLALSFGNADEDNSRGALSNRQNETNCMEQRVADASALVEWVVREREEREQFGREIEACGDARGSYLNYIKRRLVQCTRIPNIPLIEKRHF